MPKFELVLRMAYDPKTLPEFAPIGILFADTMTDNKNAYEVMQQLNKHLEASFNKKFKITIEEVED